MNIVSECQTNEPNSSFESIKKRINAGEDVNQFYKNITCLKSAIYADNFELVKFLIEKGADVNLTDNVYSYSPLHVACSHGDINIVKYLVDKGSKINFQDKEGQSPVAAAIMYEYLDIVKYLVDNGADLLLQNEFGKTMAEQFHNKLANEELKLYLTEQVKKQRDNKGTKIYTAYPSNYPTKTMNSN